MLVSQKKLPLKLKLFFVLAFILFSEHALANVTIIDNGMPGTRSTGSWLTSSSTEGYNNQSLYGRNGSTYTWTTRFTQNGKRAVYIWWASWSSRSNAATYSIKHANGTTNVTINQKIKGGQWNYVGEFYFAANQTASVTLNAADGYPVSYSADAVKFVSVSNNSNKPPSALIFNIIPKQIYQGDTATLIGLSSDDDGTVVKHRWTSDRQGVIGSTARVQYSNFTVGRHYLTYEVQDNDGNWSQPRAGIIEVLAAPSSPPPTTEVVIDNGDSGTRSTGNWPTSSATSFYGTNSLYGRNGAIYTWETTLSTAGNYGVYLWWTEWSSRATDAVYSVKHANGQSNITINQRENGGQWYYIGDFYFTPSQKASVTLNASRSSPSYSADAVKWVLSTGGASSPSPRQQPSNSIPQARITSSPSQAYSGDRVTLKGTGSDSDGRITGHRWMSNIQGALGSSATVSTSNLRVGTHQISYQVQDNDEAWSEKAITTLSIVKKVSQAAVELIIDNGDTGTSSTGSWASSSSPSYYGTNSLYARNGATYTWTATLPNTGRYDVYVWWADWASRSSAATYVVTHADGQTEVVVNQKRNGGQWNYIGNFNFDRSKTSAVKLLAKDGSPVSYSADAIKFTNSGTSRDNNSLNNAPVDWQSLKRNADRVISVSNTSEMKSAISNARPGDYIVIKSNHTLSGTFSISSFGTPEKPVVYTSELTRDTVFSEDIRFLINGRNNIIGGFTFNGVAENNLIRFENAIENRLTDNTFNKCGAHDKGQIIHLTQASHRNRVDHNTMINNQSFGMVVRVPLDSEGKNLYSQDNRFDHNTFRNIDTSIFDNRVPLQIGQGSHTTNETRTMIDNNLFENIGVMAINSKSNHETIVNNTFRNISSIAISLRSGQDKIVEGNRFENVDIGVRITGMNHRIINNIFYNTTETAISVPRTGYGYNADIGRYSTYQDTRYITIAHNTIIKDKVSPKRSSGIRIAESRAYGNITDLPTNIDIINNVIANTGPAGDAPQLLIYVEMTGSEFNSANLITDTNLLYTTGGALYGHVGQYPIKSAPRLNSNYKPLSGSPAINRGTPVSSFAIQKDYYNNSRDNAPDIGAVEF